MSRWTAIVLGAPSPSADEMVSRLPTPLHPIAGRAVIWHTVSALAGVSPPPERVLVAVDPDLDEAVFAEVGVEVRVIPAGARTWKAMRRAARELTEVVLVVNATALLDPEALQDLIAQPPGRWLGDASGHGVAAAWLPGKQMPPLLRLPAPLHAPNGVLAAQARYGAPQLIVENREHLAAAGRVVRDRLVARLMQGGVTFLLPETVLVDVDVRIGRDTVVYPGAVLEGHTTVGEETVIGPGCRILDSWVGSGVELKGWNYVSHTSIRNRAILEPYVRRGFD